MDIKLLLSNNSMPLRHTVGRFRSLVRLAGLRPNWLASSPTSLIRKTFGL